MESQKGTFPPPARLPPAAVQHQQNPHLTQVQILLFLLLFNCNFRPEYVHWLLLSHRLQVYLCWWSQHVRGPGLHPLWGILHDSQRGLFQVRSLILLHHQWRQSREGGAHEANAGCSVGCKDILAWHYAGKHTHTNIKSDSRTIQQISHGVIGGASRRETQALC